MLVSSAGGRKANKRLLKRGSDMYAVFTEQKLRAVWLITKGNGRLTLAILCLAFVATACRGQTTIKAVEPYYSRLQKPSNYAPFGSEAGSQYYKWSTRETLPNSRQASYTLGTRKIIDLTRVGVGQCVSLVKEVTKTTNVSASSWLRGEPVVVSNTISAIPGGTAIATFDTSGRYDSGHTAIVLARLNNTLVVADQNYISGRDKAQVVGRHALTLDQLRKYYTVKVK